MTPNNIPEIGDLVKYNPEVTAHKGAWNLDNKILKVSNIRGVDKRKDWLHISFHVWDNPKDDGCVHINKNNGFWVYGYQKKPFFILVGESQALMKTASKCVNPRLYCSCKGPTKESYTLNEKFLICTICKKEVKE